MASTTDTNDKNGSKPVTSASTALALFFGITVV